jgi:hypothetical protein
VVFQLNRNLFGIDNAPPCSLEIDLLALPDGMYLIKAVSDRQKFASFNIIKSR